MCGIAGVIRFDSIAAERSSVEAMIARLAHRGPEGRGFWASDGAALGHCRLRIIDLSDASNQPFISDDGQVVLVYNGEIYNYREIRTELISKGHAFRTTGDTEVVLRAYEEWGPDCSAHFNGMFAIGIWDAHKQQLFLTRDRFGEKPLFYWTDGKQIVFGSELKALLAVPDMPRRPDMANLHQYLSTGDLDLGETTFLEGAQSVPASHSMVWDREGRSREMRYWLPQPAVARQRRSATDRVAEFRSLLEDAVRIRLRSDVPVGTSLSGGIDSSSIVSLVRNLSESEVVPRRTFSARFLDHEFDEGDYIEAVTRAMSVEAHETWIEGDNFVSALPALQWAQEAPIGGTSVYAQWEVMRLAKEHETIVLLDGQGADELLGGYSTAYGMYWSHLLYRGRFVRLGQEIAAFSKRYGFSRVTGLYGLYYSMPAKLRNLLAERYYHSTRIMARAMRHEGRPAPKVDLPDLQRLHGLLAQQLVSSSLPELLRYADRNSMAFSREVRLPFLDHRLVEFVLGLPATDLIQGAVTKYVLRRAMRGLVPDVILDRKDKIGFEPPQDRWLRGELAPWLSEMLEHALHRTDVFDPAGVTQARTAFEAGAPDTLVWRIASTEAWFRYFLEVREGP